MTEIGRGPVVWLVAVLLLAGGASGPRPVSLSGKGAYEASLQTTERGFVVAWHDYRDGNAEIYARVLDVEGRAAGPEVRLTHSPALSFEADVAVAGNGTDLIVAWYEHPRHEPLEAWIGRSTQTGESLWQRQLSTSGRQGRNPLVRVSGHALFCAWVEASDGETAVWAQWSTWLGNRWGNERVLGQQAKRRGISTRRYTPTAECGSSTMPSPGRKRRSSSSWRSTGQTQVGPRRSPESD